MGIMGALTRPLALVRGVRKPAKVPSWLWPRHLQVVPADAQPDFLFLARSPVAAICRAHQQVQLDAVRVPREERGAHPEAAEDQ